MAIGTPEPRTDAPAKVTGAARYPADLAPADALFAQIVFSGRPHARLTALDTREADAMPGVVAVLTAADVPRNAYGLASPDQPVLVAVGGVCRWEGDHVAIVVAESEAAARRAADLLRLSWQDLPVVADLDTARRDETLVHPGREPRSNTYDHVTIRKGDVEEALGAADVVVENEFTLARQEHAYLQPEAGLAYLDESGRVTLEVAGQWAHEDRRQIARALDLPEEQVRVRYPAIGGAFGGREDVSIQIALALAAWRLHQRGETRPVRSVWSREESVAGHAKGHWMRIAMRWGATREGRVTAVDARIELDAGAYDTSSRALLRNATSFIAGPYEVPNVRADGYAVFTNNVPGAAFRGFGAPQACFAAERQMAELAVRCGLDPFEIRRRNALRPGRPGITGAPAPSGVDVTAVIDACGDAADAPERTAPPLANGFRQLAPDPAALRTGRGLACGFKNVGFSFGSPERCEAELSLEGHEAVERVVLRQAGAEVGQGAHTVLRQMAAEAVGVGLERVALEATDTARSGDAGSASASRMTFMAGGAIRLAAEAALARWKTGERPARGRAVFTPPPTQPLGSGGEATSPHVSHGVVAASVALEVDVETGQIAIRRLVCACDVGRAINPLGVRGQIEGGVVQAYGGAVLEDLVLAGGHIVNPRLSEYLIPGIADVPRQIESILVENPDPLGPWGARGMGEMPFLPVAAAIADALFDATGVWFDELPFTPERVRARLRTRDAAE